MEWHKQHENLWNAQRPRERESFRRDQYRRRLILFLFHVADRILIPNDSLMVVIMMMMVLVIQF